MRGSLRWPYHRLYGIFETLRGNHSAELTVIANDYSHASRHTGVCNPGDKSRRLRSDRANANPPRFSSHASTTNIDIITPRGEINTR